MLVISHDNHIVRHHTLLGPVIMVRVSHRHIIVHRQHNAISSTGNGKLPDKLNKGFPCIQTDIFKVNVDAVQIILPRSCYQVADQIPSAVCAGKQLIHIHIRTLGLHVAHKRPNLKPHPMRPVHIISRGKAGKLSLVAGEPEPCRRDHIESLRLRHNTLQRLVSIHATDHMPAQINLIIPGIGLIVDRHICRRRLQRLHRLFSQPLILHIADEGILRLHLRPVFHLLQHNNRVSPGDVRQDITLDAALIAHLRIL